MHLGCVTYNVLKDWDLDTIVAKMPELGYEAVELRTEHKHGVEPTLGEAERRAVRKKFEASKLRLLSYGTHVRVPVARPGRAPEEHRRRRSAGSTWRTIPARWGVKVRPNGLPKEVPRGRRRSSKSAQALQELGEYGAVKGIEIWMEVHGRDTQNPPVAAAILKAAGIRNVGACWNSNPTDVVNGSVKPSFDLLRPCIRNCHINELTNGYPWRELFRLLRQSGYDRYTLCECAESQGTRAVPALLPSACGWN